MLTALSCSDFSNLNKRPLWRIVGGRNLTYGAASHIDITIDADGLPIVAYRDEEYGGLAVKKFNGSEWEPLGSTNISGNEIYYTNIEMAGSTPVVAFKDMGSDSISGRLSVMQYREGEWEFVGKRGITDSTVAENDLYSSHNGVLLTTVNESLFYVACKTTSSSYIFQWQDSEWIPVSDGLPENFTSDHDLVAPDISSLYYIFNDDYTGKVYKWNGAQWSSAGSNTIGKGSNYKIGIFNNIPYITFSISSSLIQTRFNKAVVKKFNGNTWQFVGDSAQKDPYTISDKTASQISLVIDDTGNLYVCYSDWSKPWFITSQRYNGLKWQQLGEKGFNNEDAHYVRMALSGAIPYIAYQSSETLQAVVMVYDPL